MLVGELLMMAIMAQISMDWSVMKDVSRGVNWTLWWTRMARPPPALPVGRSFLKKLKPGKTGDFDWGISFVSWMHAIFMSFSLRKTDSSVLDLLMPLILN